jgi:hypothetical protein
MDFVREGRLFGANGRLAAHFFWSVGCSLHACRDGEAAGKMPLKSAPYAARDELAARIPYFTRIFAPCCAAAAHEKGI